MGRAISAARRDAERKLVRELAARELPQAIDRGHRVNVDRVHVVDVVVHAARDREKLRHHREQQPDVVQLADHRAAPRPRLGHGAHELDEERRRLRGRPQALAPVRIGGGAHDGVARERQHRRLLAHAGGVDAHRQRGVVLERRRLRDRDLDVEELDAAAEVHRGSRLAAPARGPQALEETGSRARDGARVQVVVLHQALGGARPVVAVSHRDAEGLLLLEPEAVGLPARARVEAVSHAPQELLGRGDLVRLARDEHAEAHELAPSAELGRRRPPRPRGSARAPPSARRRDRAARRRRSSRRARAGTPSRRSARADAGLGVEAVDERAEVFLAEEPLAGRGR